jgi:hypothetical protein
VGGLARCLVAVVLAVALPAHAADLAQGAREVRDRALADTTAWRLVESLTTQVGPRPVWSSPVMARARDWGVAALTRLGFENVHAEPFVTKVWARGAESAEVVAPAPQKLQILGLGASAPTPPGGITAPIAVFPTYQALLDAPVGSLSGKIAVVVQAMPRTQDASGYGALVPARAQGAVEAARRGAVAYLVRSLSTADTRLPHAGYSTPAGIPAAALSPPDAEQLARLAAGGQPVVVHLAMASSVEEAVQRWNVVGEIRGAERPDEVIVVGGHLDSWDMGTGAIDDGAGLAITTAAARLATQGQRPKRTLRVVLWGAEEQEGSGGAFAHPAQRSADQKAAAGKVVVTGEADIGAAPVWRAALPAGSSDTEAMRAFRDAVVPLKVVVPATPPQSGGADISAGTPFVQFAQDATHYFDWHHSADDTLDKIRPDELAQAVAVWAAFLYVTANSDVEFREKAAPAR